MQFDIIEVKVKRNWKRNIFIIVLILLIVFVITVTAIYYAKLYNFTIFSNVFKNKIFNNTKTNLQQTSEMENVENINSVLLPVCSDNAHIKLRKIYNKETKIAYLTFDDGPTQAVTPLILDILKEENIKATFFVIGRNVKNNPEIIKRAYLEGHFIANHGYSHEYSKIYQNVNEILEEYNKTENCIQNAIGNPNYHSHLFRFPGGSTGREI